MASLTTRIASALAGLAIVFGSAYWGGADALVVLCVLAILITVYEYEKMAFLPLGTPASMRMLFLVCCGGCLWALTYKDSAIVYFGAINCLLFSSGIWLSRGRLNNEILLKTLSMASAGMLYCVVLPSFVARTLFLPHGIAWFFALLVMVFFGDTCAYFGGAFFGKHLLMPSLSPKKTVEGALVGAAGTVITGCIFTRIWLVHVPFTSVLAMSLVTAFVAQSGDLFASLVKRVAQVKDSGHIMPGHGGVLDRFDGVYFAAPVIYAFAINFENLLT